MASELVLRDFDEDYFSRVLELQDKNRRKEFNVVIENGTFNKLTDKKNHTRYVPEQLSCSFL